MPYADLGQFKFHYREAGEKNKDYGTLLFLHGFTLDSRMWQNELDYFSRKYHVIAVDLKGHGLSDAPASGYTRAERSADVIKFLDVLKLESVHLVGLSYGGTTGIGIALTRPEKLKSLTLVSSAAAGYQLSPKISKIDQLAREKGVDAAKSKWIQTSLMWYKQDKADIKSFLKTMMEEHSGAIWADPKRGHYPVESDLEKVKTIDLPTLVIAGELDKLFVPLARRLHEEIPTSKLRILPEVGHIVNLEAPEQFIDMLNTFLSDL